MMYVKIERVNVQLKSKHIYSGETLST